MIMDNDNTLQDFLRDLFAPAYCPANPVDDEHAKLDPFAYRAWRPEYAGQEPPF